MIDKKLEYIQAQRESIQAANEEKKNIQSLISDSYDRMLEVLQKLIDKRKSLLESEKDLFDFEKDVSQKSKNITDFFELFFCSARALFNISKASNQLVCTLRFNLK